MEIKKLWLLFINLMYLDIFTTYIVVNIFHGKEINPIINYILNNFGFIGFILVKLLFLWLFCLFIKQCSINNVNYYFKLAIFISIIPVMVNIVNIILFLMNLVIYKGVLPSN